jgi:hypothetical protein
MPVSPEATPQRQQSPRIYAFSRPRCGSTAGRCRDPAGMHPVPVGLDLMQPFCPFRRLVNQLHQLRFDPSGQPTRFAVRLFSPRFHHASCARDRAYLHGRNVRLFKVFDLRDVLRGMGKLKGNALAMPARGEMPTLDDSHLMRHLGRVRDHA